MQMRSCVWMITVILLSYQTSAMAQRNPEVEIDRWPGVVPVYTCHQVPDGGIIIDGQMTDDAWAGQPRISFADLTHGTPPAHDGYAIVTWDHTDLYIGFNITQPNRIAEITTTEQGYESESRIMLTDQFCEIFLDPDGDGLNYLEWHFNSAGAKADLMLTRPSSRTAALDLGVPFVGYANTADWHWSLPGVRHAVHVDEMAGTWQVEVAIPWASLAPYAKISGPPAYAKTWRMLLGRVDRNAPGAKPVYWSWPVMGMEQCHLPARWGLLYFLPTEANVGGTK